MIDRMLCEVRSPLTYYYSPKEAQAYDRENTAALRARLQSAHVIIADNAAAYFYAHVKTTTVGSVLEKWSLSDFPNLAPPAPRIFVEYATPGWVHDETANSPLTVAQRRAGCTGKLAPTM